MRQPRSAAPAPAAPPAAAAAGSGPGMSALCDPSGPPAPPAPAAHGPASPLSAQELAQEIKAFLTGVDPVLGHQLSTRDHARCGLLLLRSLPPARAAVLDHLRGVFDESVRTHLATLDDVASPGPQHLRPPLPSHVPSGGPGLEDVIQEVQQVLSEFIRANPKAWAPVVSAWSIDLMGQLSSKYSGRHQRVPHAAGSLNELLQLWMGCRATRTLMDIYVQCLSALIGSCPDACVDALLDTSVQHSPHFDWVVAHIGSSFPGTIISRVLSCGLKDFCVHGGAGGGSGGAGGPPPTPSADAFPSVPAVPGEKRVPKIASVVGILGHLASRHGDSIRRELLRMFHESLAAGSGVRGSDPSLQATVPFLLQLAVMSPALLGTVSGELVDCLKPPSVLSQLQQHLQVFSREELDNMLSLAVHLVSQASGAGAYRLLQFLVDTAMPASVITPPGLAVPDAVREACDRLIQLLLLHLQKLVHNRGGSPGDGLLGPPPPPRPVPFLDALRSHVGELCGETLRLERKRFLWQHQLLGLLSVYTRPSCGPEALGHLLSRARTPEELSLATQLFAGLVVSLSGLLPLTLCSCLARVHAGTLLPPFTARLLRNLTLLVGWEQQGGEGPTALGARVGEAVSAQLPDLAPLLLHPEEEVAEAASSLLAICPFPQGALLPAQLLSLVRAGVSRFFASLRLHGPPGVSSASQLLIRLSQASSAGLKAVLQLLVEGALHRGNAELFGGEGEAGNENASATASSSASAYLLETNRRHTAAVPGPGGVWSVFHAGVIGRGLKPPRSAQSRSAQEVIYNTQSLLRLLVHCCSVSSGNAVGDCWAAPALSPEAAKAVAVTLVESVCPDAAGAELTWPPEDHARTTVERDLRIGRRFREHPLLFELLKLVAAAPPALCYCSVLLRGLLAALLGHWEASRHLDTSQSPWQLEASCTLVAVMAEGSLLPPTLGNMHEVFSQLAPFEVRLLLLSVWGFLREHGPLPQKFAFQPEKGRFARDFSREGGGAGGPHLAVLHSVLHRNIDRLGLFSGRFQAWPPSASAPPQRPAP
ncbi:integrator complex subunit 5 isoform X1 [Antechinus flavipes]|uniref:integrator complex subunit 5 isoform X1 n=1 Tax=Antechinus flavipes TaxID=38775 RepID=UPI002236561A|nr:integrator complex subunit 5 isoform X1 [Antechinus flavipes]